MPRRRKTRGRVFSVRQSRPKDKQIQTVALAVSGGTRSDLTLATITFPGTIAGLMWDLGGGAPTGGFCNAIWIISVIRQGLAPSQINLASGNMIQPEQNVMAWGCVSMDTAAAAGTSVWRETGRTKSMRKLMGGDILNLSCRAIGAGVAFTLFGAVQFFILS